MVAAMLEPWRHRDYDHFACMGEVVFLYAGGDTVDKNGCDYYHAIESKDKQNCPNCLHWSGSRCGIEYKVKANNKTELVHECFPTPGRSKHVRGLWF
ncbi:hypothetical protein SATMO3_11930 [Sporomusa aerivorans]